MKKMTIFLVILILGLLSCKKEEPPIVIEEKTYVLEAETDANEIGKKLVEAIDTLNIVRIQIWDLYTDGTYVSRFTFDFPENGENYFKIDGGFLIINQIIHIASEIRYNFNYFYLGTLDRFTISQGSEGTPFILNLYFRKY